MSSVYFTKIANNNIDIVAFQGKTIEVPVIWGGDSPIDVTGYDAIMTIKDKAGDDETIASFTTTNSRVSIGTTNGLITFTMSASDSSSLTAPFKGVYEIEVTDDNSKVNNIYGDFDLRPEV